jgi:cathepsin L
MNTNLDLPIGCNSTKKSYHHEEFMSRFNTWKSNYDFIEEFNQRNNGVTLAMNHLGDLSNAEYRSIYNGFIMSANWNESLPIFKTERIAADNVDWRTKGAVTAVKNQGQCGSCWAFSTTGTIEGCHVISGGSLVSLSEKNVMDCSWSYGNQGCNGGWPASAIKYVIANKGIDTESSYPYSPVSSHTCKYNAANKGASATSQNAIAHGSESSLQSAVDSGPVSVAIDASHSSFQFYHSGVYYEPACSSSRLDHAVLAVGYGSDSTGKAYWIVKNSWGTGWGSQGYIMMSRNRNNNCGIASSATIPKGC